MRLSVPASAFVVLMGLGALPAQAQHDTHSSRIEVTASPYAGMEMRSVKALSDQQIADLKAGRGMSLALAAELNGYPGPLHVLEHAAALQLSQDQRSRTKAMIEAMKAETIPIGERIVAEEVELDRSFVERRVTKALLEAAVSRTAAAQGELRAAHLRYHLSMIDLLTPAQAAHYAKLRGYSRGSP